MTDKLVKITCDWCGDYEETRLKGYGEKRLRKEACKRGWLSLVVAGSFTRDFCSEECYEYYKEDIK